MFQRNGKLLIKRFSGYFLPTVLTTMALSMSIMINLIVVGNMLGSAALVSVNLGLPLMQGYAAIFILFGAGGSVLAAFHKGKHDSKAANHAFTATLTGLASSGLVFALCGGLFLDKLTLLLGGDNPAIRESLSHFIEPLIYGAPFIILIPGMTYFIRTDGHPGLAAAVLVVANIVNLGADILFIHLLGNVRGAALAIVTGYAVSGIMVLFYLASSRCSFRITLSALRLNQILKVIQAGLPGGISACMVFLKILFINSLVLSIAGKSGMVAFSGCLACMSLGSMFVSGASQTMMPIIGVLFGQKDFAGIRFVVRRALKVLLCITATFVTALEFFPTAIFTLLGISGGEELAIGTNAVRFFVPSLLGTAFTFFMMYYAQTLQQQKTALTITLIQGLVVIVPAAWLLSRWLGLEGIWLAFSLAEAITIAVIFLMTHRISTRSEGQVKGLLMLPEKNDDVITMDVTIANTLEEAVRLSEAVTRFCRDGGVGENAAMQVGIAIEEMAVNTVMYGGNPPGASSIDISVSISDDTIRISFRDEGIPFNPVDYTAPEQQNLVYSGINLIRKLADRIDYGYTIGFNTNLITIKKTTGN